jgi:hypothetical protein
MACGWDIAASNFRAEAGRTLLLSGTINYNLFPKFKCMSIIIIIIIIIIITITAESVY